MDPIITDPRHDRIPDSVHRRRLRVLDANPLTSNVTVNVIFKFAGGKLMGGANSGSRQILQALTNAAKPKVVHSHFDHVLQAAGSVAVAGFGSPYIQPFLTSPSWDTLFRLNTIVGAIAAVGGVWGFIRVIIRELAHHL